VVEKMKGKVPGCMLGFLSKPWGFSQHGVAVAKSGSSGNEAFPVVLFSHGLFGTLDMYKTFCASLAREGYIVVAPEHEDGSAMCAYRADGSVVDKVSPPKGIVYDQMHVSEFRRPFLQHRVGEMRTILRGMLQDSSTPVAWTDVGKARLAEILGRTDSSNIFLAGHSFGASSCLMALREPAEYWSITGAREDPSKSMQIRFKACLMYDLWGTSIPAEAEAAGLVTPPGGHPIPLFCLFSEGWARGREGESCMRYAENTRARSSNPVLGPLFIPGTGHQFLSDAALTLTGPLARKFGLVGDTDRDSVYQCIARWSVSFLRLCQSRADSPTQSDLQGLQEEMLEDPVVSIV